MPIPFAPLVSLTAADHRRLQALDRASSTPQALAFRCRLILRAAEPDRPTNGQIAAEFSCDRHTVAAWRRRFLEHGFAGLQDAPRPGRPRDFSPSGPHRGSDHGLRKHRRA
jgi:transposase-like protein